MCLFLSAGRPLGSPFHSPPLAFFAIFGRFRNFTSIHSTLSSSPPFPASFLPRRLLYPGHAKGRKHKGWQASIAFLCSTIYVRPSVLPWKVDPISYHFYYIIVSFLPMSWICSLCCSTCKVFPRESVLSFSQYICVTRKRALDNIFLRSHRLVADSFRRFSPHYPPKFWDPSRHIIESFIRYIRFRFIIPDTAFFSDFFFILSLF